MNKHGILLAIETTRNVKTSVYFNGNFYRLKNGKYTNATISHINALENVERYMCTVIALVINSVYFH